MITRKRATTLILAASVGHRHGAQGEPLAGRKPFGFALELAASSEDVAAARRAHRRGIAGVEHDLGEFLDLLPVRAFMSGARPGIERDEIDLGRNALDQLD